MRVAKSVNRIEQKIYRWFIYVDPKSFSENWITLTWLLLMRSKEIKFLKLIVIRKEK